MLSISFGFKKLSGFLAEIEPTLISVPSEELPPKGSGTPSTTNNGSLLDLTEDVPLILIETPEPDSPLPCEIWTPAVFP